LVPLSLDRATSAALARAGDTFVLEALRGEAARRDNVPALFQLAGLLTKRRRYDEGLTIDRRLVRLEPREPILRYNLACSLALCGRQDEALEELGRSIDLGYDDLGHMVHDRDLRSLRGDPRFHALARRLAKKGADPFWAGNKNAQP